jgi:pre-mRNA-processing factor SLU7
MTLKSRENFRKEKDLDEARKAGIAPAAVDSDGKVINPHIPQYMTKGLWYLNQDGVATTLKHQKKWKNDKCEDDKWYDRGVKIFHATEYRKGACVNCGSMTHDFKYCLERPRKIGAKFTGKQIAPDDKIEDLAIYRFEAKRDRWNGYDICEHDKIRDRYEKIEKIRRKIKHEKIMSNRSNEKDKDHYEDKMKDEEHLNYNKVEKRINTVEGGSTGTVRNLRIREDTAKYLLNLDLESAYYDPKSRSMREDPTPEKPIQSKIYAGDNNIKASGDELKEFKALMLHQDYATNIFLKRISDVVPTRAEVLLYKDKDRYKKSTLDNKKLLQNMLEH